MEAVGLIYAFRPPAGEGLAAVAGRLRAGGWLPDPSWWFAWRVDEIRLPAVLSDLADLGGDADAWDVARVFSAKGELRLAHGGGRARWWWLAEAPLGADLAEALGAAIQGQPCLVDPGIRILAGGPLSLPATVEVEGQAWGEIRFPRALRYRLGRPVPEKHAIIADLRHYRDPEQGRLLATRYAGLGFAADSDKRYDAKAYPLPEDCHAAAT